MSTENIELNVDQGVEVTVEETDETLIIKASPKDGNITLWDAILSGMVGTLIKKQQELSIIVMIAYSLIE